MISVYVIGPKTGLQKIGHSAVPFERVKDLQVGSPLKLRVHFAMQHPIAARVEKAAHRVLADDWSHGEWFRTSPEAAIKAVHTAIESLIQADKDKAAKQAALQTEIAAREAQLAAELAAVNATAGYWKKFRTDLDAEAERLQREDPAAWQALMDQWEAPARLKRR